MTLAAWEGRWKIECDHRGCYQDHFGLTGDRPSEAIESAAEAGWQICPDGGCYCPQHADPAQQDCAACEPQKGFEYGSSTQAA